MLEKQYLAAFLFGILVWLVLFLHRTSAQNSKWSKLIGEMESTLNREHKLDLQIISNELVMIRVTLFIIVIGVFGVSIGWLLDWNVEQIL